MKDYSKAFVEVLEILKYIPEEEYKRIPEDKIKFFKDNMDKEYNFKIDPKIELSKQNISREANAIIVTLFRDYFATEKQKEKLENILRVNEEKLEQEKHQKYDPDKIFEKIEVPIVEPEKEPEMMALQEIKEETFFEKFVNYIKRLLIID